jgi:hypothetical protein
MGTPEQHSAEKDAPPMLEVQRFLVSLVLGGGRAQVLLARDAGLSEKHVSQMLTGKAMGTLDAWQGLLNAAGIVLTTSVTSPDKG